MQRRDFMTGAAALSAGLLLGRNALAASVKQGQAALALPDAPLWQWQANELAAGIARGAISSQEAVESCLGRIAEANPGLKAVVHEMHDEALRAAQRADQRRGSDALPPLHGVPVTVKVNQNVAGQPNTNGLLARRDNIAADNSPVVQNLLDNGAVIIGLTSTPEFSFRWYTESPLYGRTLNPWRADITPGGSSGGAASAVAAGMCPIAHGNDIAGSIRYPAYACGVVGLRPSVGRIPTGLGLGFAGQQIATQGPLARSVADARLAFLAMASSGGADPNWVSPVAAAEAREKRVVGLVDELPGIPLDASVRDNLAAVAKMLEDAGYRVEPVSLPDHELATRTWLRIVMTEIRLQLLPVMQREGSEALQAAVQGMLEATPETGLDEYVIALATRNNLRVKWRALFQRYDALIAPVSASAPLPWGLDAQGGAAMAQIMRQQAILMSVALSGLPALSVPSGLQGERLPAGVQVIADHYREDRCFQVAAVIEAAARMPRAYQTGPA